MRNRLWTYMCKDKVLCRTTEMKIVGDTYEDYIVWMLDYRNRIIYLTK